MSGIDLSHLKRLVVQPTLATMGHPFASLAAVNLLTGTALVESSCTYLAQIGGGPALGLWQMEPATESDCWQNWLAFNENVSVTIGALMASQARETQLQTNLAYACAMARIKFWRAVPSLPAATDAVGLSEYHKAFYNTTGGAANAATNVPLFDLAIAA